MEKLEPWSLFKCYVMESLSVIKSYAKRFVSNDKLIRSFLLVALAIQQVSLGYKLEDIKTNAQFNIDKARRDFLKGIHYYYNRGCFDGQRYNYDVDGHIGDFCKKNYEAEEQSIVNDLDQFAKPGNEN